jgi:hypothetical protein
VPRRLAGLALAVGLVLAASGCAAPGNRDPWTIPPTAPINSVAVACDISGRGDGGFNDIA